MTYVSRHTRLLIPRWLEEGDEGYIYALRRKRSDQKLKLQNSCEDLRAWVDDECLRTQHFVESMSHSEFLGKAPFGIFGRFIPISYLADFLCKDGKKKKESIQEIYPVQENKKKKKKSVEKKPSSVKSEQSTKKDELIVMKPTKSEPVPGKTSDKPIELQTIVIEELPIEDQVIALEQEQSMLYDIEQSVGPTSTLEGVNISSEVITVEPEPEPDITLVAKPEECKEESTASQQEEDNLMCMDLLAKYSALLRQAMTKLDEIDCAANISQEPCICEDDKFENFSFQEFFKNCAKVMMEESENSDANPDGCCQCCIDENTDESLPPTPDPSICPSVSCDQLELLSEKPGRIEDDLLRRISIFQQRLNQIEEYWKDLNNEIKNSQKKVKEYEECTESDKVKELREKLQELIMERIKISRQKCKALKELKNLKLSACTRFTKSDLAVKEKESNNFGGKFPSCQCGFEDCSTSLETSSSERKSRVSFSPVVRDSNNKQDEINCKETKSHEDLTERKAKSETNILVFEKALKHYEKRLSAYDCLDRDVEILKKKAKQTKFYEEELKKHTKCREQLELIHEEDKGRLCTEIERLKCVINRLKIKLDETSQEMDYWQGRDQEIAELEKETRTLKKKLCRSRGDYEEEKRYTNKLEHLINLQRNEIERLMCQIQKLSKFMTVDKKSTSNEIMRRSSKARSRSYSPDIRKCVQMSDSANIIKTLIPSTQEKPECSCSLDDPSSQNRNTRHMDARATIKFEKQKYIRNFLPTR